MFPPHQKLEVQVHPVHPLFRHPWDYQVASMLMKQTKMEAVETEVIEAVAGDLILASRLS